MIYLIQINKTNLMKYRLRFWELNEFRTWIITIVQIRIIKDNLLIILFCSDEESLCNMRSCYSTRNKKSTILYNPRIEAALNQRYSVPTGHRETQAASFSTRGTLKSNARPRWSDQLAVCTTGLLWPSGSVNNKNSPDTPDINFYL